MRSLLVQIGCRAAYGSGLLSLAMAAGEPRRRRAPGGRFQILVYHRVSDAADAFVPAAPTRVFEAHMRELRRHFHVLSLTDLLSAADRNEVPARAVAVTLDDGYEDTYTTVYPIIRRYGIPVTVYLATGGMDHAAPMWNDRLGVAIRDTAKPLLDGVPGCRPLPLGTERERRHALHQALTTLKPFPPAERHALIDRIIRTLAVDDRARTPRMLRWDQIREMAAHGVEFGAHTVHHPILSAIPADEVRAELSSSKRAIEDRVQQPARHFAYPNGRAADFNVTTKALVREAGFVSAASSIFGTNTPTTDRYALLRGGSWEPSAPVFAAKLCWYRWTASTSPRVTDEQLPSPH